VPPADPGALQDAILRLMNDPELAASYGKAGYDRVQRHLTWEAAAQRTVEAYRKAIRDYH